MAWHYEGFIFYGLANIEIHAILSFAVLLHYYRHFVSPGGQLK